MPYLVLAVTKRVLRQTNEGNEYQKQLAIRGASTDLRNLIDSANARNKIRIPICGIFELVVGDNSAIWGVHQESTIQNEDFNDLYSLLSRRPDSNKGQVLY